MADPLKVPTSSTRISNKRLEESPKPEPAKGNATSAKEEPKTNWNLAPASAAGTSGVAARRNESGFVSGPAAVAPKQGTTTEALPFSKGANGGLSPAVDFSSFLSMKDPDEKSVSASRPMLTSYLKTGQFGEFKGEKGVPIRYAVFAPPPGVPIKGVINLVSGRGESFAKYSEVLFNLRDLRAQGYVIASMDNRGQGFSGREIAGDSQKGHVNDFKDYVRDEKTFTDLLSKQYPNAPKTMMGHSLGGGIATRYLETNPGDYKKGVLLSPMLDPNTKLPGGVEDAVAWAGGKMASESYALGKGPYKPKTVEDRETQSQGRLDLTNGIMEKDFPGIGIGGATWGWLKEAVEADRQMMQPEEISKLKDIDLHLLTAGDDSKVDAGAQKTFAEQLKLGDKAKNYDGAQHELLFAPDGIRNEVMKDLRAKLLAPAK